MPMDSKIRPSFRVLRTLLKNPDEILYPAAYLTPRTVCVGCLRQGKRWASTQGPRLSIRRASQRSERPIRLLSNTKRHSRRLATVSNSETRQQDGFTTPTTHSLVSPKVDIEPSGPMAEYDERVHSHRLRDDEHQRGVKHSFPDPWRYTDLNHRHCPKSSRPPRHARRLPSSQSRPSLHLVPQASQVLLQLPLPHPTTEKAINPNTSQFTQRPLHVWRCGER